VVRRVERLAAWVIGRVAATGVTERVLPDPDSIAVGIATGPDRAIWVALLNRVERLAPDGTSTSFPFLRDAPLMGLVAGPDALWVASLTAVYRLTPDGARRGYRLPRLQSVRDIAAAPDGSISGLGRLLPSGELTELELPDRPRYDYSIQHGITQGPDGAIWFTETNEDDSDDVLAGRVGRLDVARLLPNLLTARLERRSMRGRRNRLLRIRFAASRDATALLYVGRGIPVA